MAIHISNTKGGVEVKSLFKLKALNHPLPLVKVGVTYWSLMLRQVMLLPKHNTYGKAK